jgi:hypothetical protein
LTAKPTLPRSALIRHVGQPVRQHAGVAGVHRAAEISMTAMRAVAMSAVSSNWRRWPPRDGDAEFLQSRHD